MRLTYGVLVSYRGEFGIGWTTNHEPRTTGVERRGGIDKLNGVSRPCGRSTVRRPDSLILPMYGPVLRRHRSKLYGDRQLLTYRSLSPSQVPSAAPAWPSARTFELGQVEFGRRVDQKSWDKEVTIEQMEGWDMEQYFWRYCLEMWIRTWRLNKENSSF